MSESDPSDDESEVEVFLPSEPEIKIEPDIDGESCDENDLLMPRKFVIELDTEATELETEATNNALPEKSRKIYEKCYNKFMEWKMAKKISSLSENVLLAYFQESATKSKSSSLVAEYSMLKATLNINDQTDISNYSKLKAFLKRISQGHRGKQSKIFVPSELKKFLNEAPDCLYLTTKVALLFGIIGGCRREELYSLKYKHVKDVGSMIIVNIIKNNKIRRTFSITGKYYEICKRYMSCRPYPCDNPYFFLNCVNGKSNGKNIGINKFGNMCKTVASYLKLPNPEKYTGHSFRRTAETILVDTNGDITLKHRGWYRSTTQEAKGYIENSQNDIQFVDTTVDTNDDVTLKRQQSGLKSTTQPEAIENTVPSKIKPSNMVDINGDITLKRRHSGLKSTTQQETIENTVENKSQFLNTVDSDDEDDITLKRLRCGLKSTAQEATENTVQSKIEFSNTVDTNGDITLKRRNGSTEQQEAKRFLENAEKKKIQFSNTLVNSIEMKNNEIKISTPTTFSHITGGTVSRIIFSNCTIQNIHIHQQDKQ